MYFRRFRVVKKVVGQSYAFHHQINGGLRRIILLLNEDVEARDISGFMKTSDGIRRKLYFQGKIFYCGRCHSKYTFHEGCPSDQEDEEQQPPPEQNENREQQDLPEGTPEVHWNPETPSERNEVEQNDAALGQSTVLRQRRETEANWRVIVRLPAMRLSNNQTRWYRGNR